MLIENQKHVEKERETYKSKMGDIEVRCKELENKRSTMIFDFEKERAKFSLERDHLNTQKSEMQEQIDRLERRKEALLRENEKLKNESRSKRTGYVPGSGAGKFNATMFGSTLLNKMQKENSTTISQNFVPGMMSKFIGDGNEKYDPLGTKEPNTSRLGTGLMYGMHQKKNSGTSFKSGSAAGNKETSETGSNV